MRRGGELERAGAEGARGDGIDWGANGGQRGEGRGTAVGHCC